MVRCTTEIIRRSESLFNKPGRQRQLVSLSLQDCGRRAACAPRLRRGGPLPRRPVCSFLATAVDPSPRMARRCCRKRGCRRVRRHLARICSSGRGVDTRWWWRQPGSWYWVDDLLREHGAALTLAHATKAVAITGTKVKTGVADARTLLTMLRLNMVPEAHVISPELRELRGLLRMRLRRVEKRTSTTNSIARLLEKYNRTAVDALPALAQVQADLHREQIGMPTLRGAHSVSGSGTTAHGLHA
jgi:hypothetical protein